MTAATRIYVVAVETGEKYLIDATSAAQAVRHVTRNMCTVKVATPHEVARLCGEGVRVEASKESEADQAAVRG